MFNPFKRYQEGEGEGASGGGGGEGDGKDKPITTEDIANQLKMVTQAVTMLATGHDELKTTQSQIAEALEALKPKVDAPKPLTPETMFEGVDLTDLSQADLAKLVLDKAAALVDERIGKVKQESSAQVANLAEQFNTKNAAEAVATMKKDNPDFFEWTAEMRKIIQDNPTLDVRKAYILAKAENPEKTAAMVKKYHKPENPKRTFGLLPTSATGSAGVGKMNAREAALAAFDEVFGAAGVNTDTKVI